MGLTAWIFKYEKPKNADLPIGKNVKDLYKMDYAIFNEDGMQKYNLTPYCTKVDLVETRFDDDGLLKFLGAPEGARLGLDFYRKNGIEIGYYPDADSDAIYQIITEDEYNSFYYDVKVTRYVAKETTIACFRKEWGLHDMILDLYHAMPDSDPNKDQCIPLTQDMIEKINAFCEEFHIFDDEFETIHIENMDDLFYEHSW